MVQTLSPPPPSFQIQQKSSKLAVFTTSPRYADIPSAEIDHDSQLGERKLGLLVTPTPWGIKTARAASVAAARRRYPSPSRWLPEQ